MGRPVRFGILGSLQVRSVTGETVSVGGPRPRALLVMLLLNAGRVVSLDRLVAGQYGDGPPEGAANAVQAHVSRLRRSLPTEVIEFDGGGYRLVADPDDVDAYRFEWLAREGRRLLAAGHHATAAAVLREALALWRGSALVDLPYGQAQAARLDELRLTAIEDLIEAELVLPEGSSVAELRELVCAYPLRERLRGQLMRALQLAGRPAEALAEFAEARRLLAEELGADPSPELADIHLAILRAEQPTPPSWPGLPAQLTSFVGRDRELARLDELHGERLVTIIGPGGAGKTRLAIESAGRTQRRVCFADVSAVAGGDQVAPTVLGALGLREATFPSSFIDPTRRLVAALDRDLLLILDNCEHVIVTAAALARTLLAECPRLSILATSREPLGLTGETLVALAPLDTPPPDVPNGLAATYPAVQLFADRSAAVRPGFVVGPDNIGPVIEICAALDGLPLAIELAAARTRQFTVKEIVARLVEYGPFRLLSRGDRTAAVRHQTLQAVVEWSWNLLRPGEQTMARRFTVFTGGATLAGVEAVCGVADTDERLADLVDKSLVVTDGERYRMLETIRLFCAERLAEAGEQEQLRRAHARYHLDFAQRADPHLRRAEQLDWLALVSAEHRNLVAALRWAAREDQESAFRLVAALAAYWWLSGRRSQVGEIAAHLLREQVPEGLEEEYVACVVHAVPRAAPEHWARAEEIMRTRDQPLKHPFGAALWGMAAGPPDSPELEIGRLFDADPWNVALQRLSRGLLKVLGGQTADGEDALRDVLLLFRALGERWGTAQALDWLAHVAGWRGEWSRAHAMWAEALDLREQLGALEESADLLCRRAACLGRQGDLDAACSDYQRAAELSRNAGRVGTPPEVELGLGEIARWRGDAREAGYRLAEALESAVTGDLAGESTRARVLTALGRLAELSGRPDEALRRHRQAVATARAGPFVSGLADAVEGLAGVALLTGSGERAALLLGTAVALRGTALTGDVDVARIAERAGELAGATAFAEAYARGAAMSAEQALTTINETAG